MELEGKAIVVTGGAGAIGFATAQVLLDDLGVDFDEVRVS